MGYVLQDVDHLFDGLDKDTTTLLNEDYIGLANPGPLSPGSLGFLENIIGNTNQYRRTSQHLPEYNTNSEYLDIVDEYGSNSPKSLDFLENHEKTIKDDTNQLSWVGQGRSRSKLNRKPPTWVGQGQLQSNIDRKLHKSFASNKNETHIEIQNDFPYCITNYAYNSEDGDFPLWDSPNTKSLDEDSNSEDDDFSSRDSPNTQSLNDNYNHTYERNSRVVNSVETVVHGQHKPHSSLKRARSYTSSTSTYENEPKHSKRSNGHKHGQDTSSHSKNILKSILVNAVLGKNQHVDSQILGLSQINLYKLLNIKDNDEVAQLDMVMPLQPSPNLPLQEPNFAINDFTKDLEYLISELSKLELSPALNEIDISIFNEMDASNIFDPGSLNFDLDTLHFNPNTIENFDLPQSPLESLSLKNYSDISEIDEVEEELVGTGTTKKLGDTKTLEELIDAYINSTSKVLELTDSNLIDDTNEPKLELELPQTLTTIEQSLPSYNTQDDAYILNEDECMNLSTAYPERNELYEMETTSAPIQQNLPSLDTMKIKLTLDEKSLARSNLFTRIQNIVDAHNASKKRSQEDLKINTSFEVGSSSTSNNNDRWQTTPNSKIFDSASTYVNNPIPLEWKNMENPRLIGNCMSIFSKSQILEAWNIICDNQNDIDTTKVSIWNPQIYMDDGLKTYNRYFPIVLKKSTKKLLAFDYRNNADIDEIVTYSHDKSWTIMPSLEWIKSDILISRVIAANDGLLVLDSGKPAISTIHINYKWVFYEKNIDDTSIYEKNQSLLTIINPLTHEYLFLPPIPFNAFKEKIGYLSFSNAKERNYQLFILGCDEIEPTIEDQDEHIRKYGINAPKMRPTHIVNFAIYSSANKKWNNFDHFENTKTNHFQSKTGHGSCAVINYGFYFGGLQLVPCPKKIMDDELPSIFYINCNIKKYQHLTHHFLLYGIGNIRIPEAPKLIRVANNKIYAITRETTNKIYKNPMVLIEVLLDEDGTPNGKYAPVVNGIMPDAYLNKLKLSSPPQKDYEVYSSGDLIAFKGSYPIFVIYDVYKTKWKLLRYERYLDSSEKKNHTVIEGVYQPDWLAITYPNF